MVAAVRVITLAARGTHRGGRARGRRAARRAARDGSERTRAGLEARARMDGARRRAGASAGEAPGGGRAGEGLRSNPTPRGRNVLGANVSTRTTNDRVCGMKSRGIARSSRVMRTGSRSRHAARSLPRARPASRSRRSHRVVPRRRVASSRVASRRRAARPVVAVVQLDGHAREPQRVAIPAKPARSWGRERGARTRVDRGPSARVRAARSRNEAGGAAFGGIFVERRDLVAVGLGDREEGETDQRDRRGEHERRV